jgi:hypothetical protein
MFAAAAATSLVASMGVQPIEKKLTMDQMLESETARRAVEARYPGKRNPLLTPLREIAAYTRAEGGAALFGGFLPLYVTTRACKDIFWLPRRAPSSFESSLLMLLKYTHTLSLRCDDDRWCCIDLQHQRGT